MKKFIKNVIIICSGEDFNSSKIIKCYDEADYKIAVDGGLKVFRDLRLEPDLLMGDIDSVDKKTLSFYPQVERISFSREKDLTDSELALQKAISFDPENIFLFASTGSYFDHSIANVLNLIRNYKENIKIKIITGNSEIFAVKGRAEFNNLAGRRISFFPASKIKVQEFQGFKYSYKKKNLLLVDFSISNMISDKKAHFKIKKGILICVLFDEGYD